MVAKALFRRAKSLFHLYDYKSAFRDISQAVAIMPDDKVTIDMALLLLNYMYITDEMLCSEYFHISRHSTSKV